MKRIYPVLAIVLILSFVLAGCGAKATPTAAPAPTAAPVAAEQPTAVPEPTAVPATAVPEVKAVKITVWHQWDGKYLDAITAAFKEYEAAHPGVTIDLSKPEDVSSALKVAIPAGEGPDIIGWANDQIGTQALQGNIIALNDLGVDEAFMNSTYEPAAVKGVIWQGKIWALPESQEGIALVYNKAVLTDKYMPTDLTDLLAKATAFKADNADKVLVCNQGFGGSDAYHVAPIYFGSGMPTYVDDAGKVYMNTPEGIKGAQWLADFSKVSLKENSYDICKAALLEGKAAAWWTGPWAIADLEAAKLDYGILTIGKPFVGIKTLMLSKNAVDRGTAETALDIIKFFTGPDVSKKLALANKTIPANTAALTDAEVQKLNTIAGFGAALNVGVPMANTPYANAQWGPVGDASVAVWTGAQTPTDAMVAAQAAIEKSVKEMN